MKKQNKELKKKVLTITFISLGVLAAFLVLTGLKIIPMNNITILIFGAAVLAYGGYMKHIADKEMEKEPVKIVDSNISKFTNYIFIGIMIVMFGFIYFLPKIDPDVMIKIMPKMVIVFRVFIVILAVVIIYGVVRSMKGDFEIEAKPGATKKQIEEAKKHALKGSRVGAIFGFVFLIVYLVIRFVFK